MEIIWHLYLVECADGSFYTGITTDVERRYADHVAGKGARYTRSHPVVRLVASRPIGSKSEALRAELAVKNLPKGEKIKAVGFPTKGSMDSIAKHRMARSQPRSE